MTNFSTGQRRKNLVAGRVAEHVKSYVYRKKKTGQLRRQCSLLYYQLYF